MGNYFTIRTASKSILPKGNSIWIINIILICLMAFVNVVNADDFCLSKFSNKRDLLTFNGFIENKGQIIDQYGNSRDDVMFLFKDKNFKCVLRKTGFSYELSHLQYSETETEMAKYKGLPEFARHTPDFKYFSHRIDIEFLNPNLNATFEKSGASDNYFHYYLAQTGNDGVKYVRYYDKVIYKDIYPNIDIEFYTLEKGLKYEIIVKPGGKIEQVKMRYLGQDNIIPESNESFRVNTSEGFIQEKLGMVYSAGNSRTTGGENSSMKTEVQASFKLSENIVGIEVDDYNRDEYLIVDPGIVWATYYGDIHREGINAVSTDELNDVLATGYTESTANIATSGAYQTTHGGGGFDAFLVKLDYSGKRLWATYLGGSGYDVGQGAAADNIWHYVFIMGYTSSQSGIASSGAYQEDYGGGYYDSFLAKFDMLGERMWSTYYGGSDAHALVGGEYIYAAAIDERFNDVYFTGVASSGNGIASSGAHQTRFGGDFDAMLVKFNTDGDRVWGTYVGGEGFDGAYGITLDPSGYITIGGYTDSDNRYNWGEEIIATEGAYKETRTGNSDAFIERFNLRGTRQWGTYFGGSDQEIVFCTAADNNKNIYIGGGTLSLNGIATTGGHQTVKDTGSTGFFAKFSPSGSRLWGSYYGGDRLEEITAMHCNNRNELLFVGYTSSENGIATPGAYMDTLVGDVIMGIDPESGDSVIVGYHSDGFIASFNGSGQRQWGSYYGGGDDDNSKSIVMDMNDNMIIGGITSSFYFIGTPGTHQSNYADSSDGFIIKFGEFVKVTNVTSPMCIGNTIQVSFETGREMNSGNIFTVQLSDSNGDFTNAVNIGTKSGRSNDVITATIPKSTIPASGYRIRVNCSNPSKIGSDNGNDLTINGLPQPVITGDSIVCSRGDELYSASTGGVMTNRWYLTNGTFIGDSTLQNVNVKWSDAAQGIIKVIQTNTVTGCIDSVQKTISINSTPQPNIIGESEVIINSVETYRTPAQSNLLYLWNVSGGTITNDNTNSEIEVNWGGTGTGYVKLVVTQKTTGCKDSLTLTIAINAVPIEINGKKTVCAYSYEHYSIASEPDVLYKWTVSGGQLEGNDADTSINVTWGQAGTGVLKIIRTNSLTMLKDTAVKNITILAVPDVKILGINEICGNDEVMYIAVDTVGVTSEWSVYNGQIIGNSKEDTVIVKWNDLSPGEDSLFIRGTLFLTQTFISTGCPFTKELRVSISDNPDAIVKGKFGVCERAIEVYQTEIPKPDYSNRWSAQGGTILGNPTDTIIQVEWGLEGTGILKLVQAAGNNCVDSNVINIDINSMPDKPTISQQGIGLVSSSETGNQWYTNNNPINGATNKKFYPDSSGYYTVQVTDENGCQSQMSAPYYFDINKVHDIAASERLFRIYPNPAENRFRIKFGCDYKGFATVKLCNALAEVLIEKEVSNISFNSEVLIDVSHLPDGMYLLQIQMGENIYYQKLVIRK